MGEYEPDDSRNVTQTDNRAPGEPPRTGPSEDQARQRRGSGASANVEEGAQAQQVARQAKGHAQQAQSQAQLRSRLAPQMGEPGNPERQEMQSEPEGPLAGNQPQAIDNRSGASAPHYDQYELNQPQNMHQQSPQHEARVRQQAGMQADAQRGFGYGADGEEEMHDAPDVSERGESRGRADRASESSDAPGAELRGYGGRGEAARKAGDQN